MNDEHTTHPGTRATAYDLLRTIKAVTGWPLERISEESCVGHEALRKIHRSPGWRGNHTTRTLLKKCLDKVSVRAFPPDTDRFHGLLDVLVEKLRPEELKDTLEHLFRPSLQAHPEWGKGTRGDCRLHWAMGHSYFETSRVSRYTDFTSVDAALSAYSQAAAILRKRAQLDDRQANDEHQAFKIELNQLGLLLNMCDRNTRSQSPKVRAWLTQCNFIPKVFAALEVEPWNLALARQGLIGASILKMEAEARGLIVVIEELCPNFFDDDVAPLPGVMAASSDPDLLWVFEQKLHLTEPHPDEGDEIDSEENDHE